MRKLGIFGLGVAAWMAAAASASATENWKLATAAQPGSVLYDVITAFIEDFNREMNGEIEMEFQFVGNEQEMTQQVIRGRLQMGATSLAGAGVAVPEGTVMNLPYAWENDAERAFVTDEFVLPVLQDLYAAKGLMLYEVADVGWNDVVCTFACLTPADVDGIKARISPSPASKIFWQRMQANGVQMPLSEAWPALETGLVVAADLPFLYYITTPAAQSAPHYVLTRHYHHPSAWIINTRLYNGLTDRQKEILARVKPDTAATRQMVADTEKPKMAEFVAQGGFVHELTDEQRSQWAELVIPGQQEMVDVIGGRAQEVYDAIQEGKKAWAAKNN